MAHLHDSYRKPPVLATFNPLLAGDLVYVTIRDLQNPMPHCPFSGKEKVSFGTIGRKPLLKG
ncbi:hypothetical protein E2562_038938 [Oryza meyeriana var. granulata]|uniref:Uncharacterized protein n=1 Tax=Oryza meyeriana var. granulata TaxID=110450 RepID=A0A6G1E7Q7_9ORYZ|nr:hypothetical protein E2562_038938 [Oryza meyeriana var. granulata]